jgi:inhibitor of KinA sporulation pathway (predicted exonuclease)
MISYEVTVDVEESLVERYVAYMRTRHIPAILATGCFAHAELNRAQETRFRQRYLANSLGDLERYLEKHAPGLRGDFAAEFPTGTNLTRQIWEEIERWP